MSMYWMTCGQRRMLCCAERVELLDGWRKAVRACRREYPTLSRYDRERMGHPAYGVRESFDSGKSLKRWSGRGRSWGGGRLISPLMRLGDEGFGVRHAAMAGAAGDRNVGLVVADYLRKVLGVEIVGHFDHHTG